MSENPIQLLRESKLFVSDIDGSIVPRLAHCIFPLTKEERKEGRWRNYFKGIAGGLNVYLGSKAKKPFVGTVEADNWGLNRAVEIVGKAGIDKERIQKKAREYYQKHKIDGFEDFKGVLDEEGIPWYFSSFTASIFGEGLKDELGAIGGTWQITRYDPENPDISRGVKMRMRNSTEKYVETISDLRDLGYRLEDCAYCGNDLADIELLENSKVSIASPKAKPEVREVCQIKLDETYGYKELAIELKNSF